jgi:aspartyl protease family protein
MKALLLCCLLLALSGPLLAEPQVRVLALFSDKALLEIDGNQRLLTKGQISPEGVRLLASNSLRALVEIAGQQLSIEPKVRIGTQFVTPQANEYRIVRDNSGHYRAAGSINGLPVDFLVDTGASIVAMNEQQARQLGIDYELKGKPMMAQTASGLAKGYRVNLDRVALGTISLTNVEGVVVEGDSPQQALLGMSFLNSLEMSNQDNILLLRQRQ